MVHACELAWGRTWALPLAPPPAWQWPIADPCVAAEHGQGVTPPPRTPTTPMLALWICVAIGLIVFGAMAYACSSSAIQGAQAGRGLTHAPSWSLWTVVPVALLVLMAFPATAADRDVRHPRSDDRQGHRYQWLWNTSTWEKRETFTHQRSIARATDPQSKSTRAPRITRIPADVDNAGCPTNPSPFPDHRRRRIHAWGVPRWVEAGCHPGLINEAGPNQDPACTVASAPSCAARTTASCDRGEAVAEGEYDRAGRERAKTPAGPVAPLSRPLRPKLRPRPNAGRRPTDPPQPRHAAG